MIFVTSWDIWLTIELSKYFVRWISLGDINKSQDTDSASSGDKMPALFLLQSMGNTSWFTENCLIVEAYFKWLWRTKMPVTDPYYFLLWFVTKPTIKSGSSILNNQNHQIWCEKQAVFPKIKQNKKFFAYKYILHIWFFSSSCELILFKIIFEISIIFQIKTRKAVWVLLLKRSVEVKYKKYNCNYTICTITNQ